MVFGNRWISRGGRGSGMCWPGGENERESGNGELSVGLLLVGGGGVVGELRES